MCILTLVLFARVQGQMYAQCLYDGTPMNDPLQRHRVNEDSVLKIAVVFHNLYLDETQRITPEQVEKQLLQLNLDFNRRHADTIDTPPVFKSVAQSANLSFCLAQLDPSGMGTTGLESRETGVPQIGFTENYYMTREGGMDIWDPSRYLNIWVCEILEDGGVAGFAESPYDIARAKDGVVVDYRYFTQVDSALHIMGRTLTHEVAHWFGISHLWGDQEGCMHDDGLNDTPPQAAAYRGCPSFPQSTCGSQDMYMNFMDLVDDTCMNLFTQDQVDLMRNNIISLRPDLAHSESCDQTVHVWEKALFNPTISPNPAITEVNINSQGVPILARLYDMQGTVIMNLHPNKPNSIGHLPTGMYFIQMSDGSHAMMQKLIKY